MVGVRNDLPDDDPRIQAMLEVYRLVGGANPLAKALDLAYDTVRSWRIAPPELTLQIERVSGVPRYVLRPDIFGSAKGSLGSGLIDLQVSLGGRVLAEIINRTYEEVDSWTRIPAELCLTVEKITGVSRYVMRPDVYGLPPDGAEFDRITIPPALWGSVRARSKYRSRRAELARQRAEQQQDNNNSAAAATG